MSFPLAPGLVCSRQWTVFLVLAAVVGVAGLVLPRPERVYMFWVFFSTFSHCPWRMVWFRSHNGFAGEILALRVGVNAGLLLLRPSRVICWLFSLSLLATVRGGTSFLCPTATKKQKQRKRLSTANSEVSLACRLCVSGT